MTIRAERLRRIITAPGCTQVAPVFDPLSARIAEMSGWQVCKLPGSTSKAANLGLPDEVALSHVSDLAETARRLGLMTDLILVADADDGGTPLQVRRAVQELEAAGVAAIEIDDVVTPPQFAGTPTMLSVGAQVAKLRAAVDSRRDPSTVIVGRTSALHELDFDEALGVIEMYTSTGIDALMLPGLHGLGISTDPRSHIEKIQAVSPLPMFVSGLPFDLTRDEAWLESNRVKLLFHGPDPYRIAVRAIHDALTHLRAGKDPAELAELHATHDVLDEVVRLA